jgi:hypothetical protein
VWAGQSVQFVLGGSRAQICLALRIITCSIDAIWFKSA